MKSKRVLFLVIIFVFSHYLHYKWNQIRNPFYNTVFSTPKLPIRFYYINIGDSRAKVEQIIGRPLSNFGGRVNYSKSANKFWGYSTVYFQIEYINDTVAAKFYAVDD